MSALLPLSRDCGPEESALLRRSRFASGGHPGPARLTRATRLWVQRLRWILRDRWLTMGSGRASVEGHTACECLFPGDRRLSDGLCRTRAPTSLCAVDGIPE
jgi:hypothetical protein